MTKYHVLFSISCLLLLSQCNPYLGLYQSHGSSYRIKRQQQFLYSYAYCGLSHGHGEGTYAINGDTIRFIYPPLPPTKIDTRLLLPSDTITQKQDSIALFAKIIEQTTQEPVISATIKIIHKGKLIKGAVSDWDGNVFLGFRNQQYPLDVEVSYIAMKKKHFKILEPGIYNTTVELDEGMLPNHETIQNETRAFRLIKHTKDSLVFQNFSKDKHTYRFAKRKKK